MCIQSQDFGLFQDDDGAAYALYSTGDKTRDNKITRLNANFTAPEKEVYTFNGEQSPICLRHGLTNN